MGVFSSIKNASAFMCWVKKNFHAAQRHEKHRLKSKG
jgi:hypothetical protein